MRATEHFRIPASAGTGTFPVIPEGSGAQYLYGGRYQIAIKVGSSATVTLQQIGPDGSTAININGASGANADGVANYDLPPGKYQIVVGTAGSDVDLTRVPVSE